MKTVNIMLADNFSRGFINGFVGGSQADYWPGFTIHGLPNLPDDDSTYFESHGDAVLGTLLRELDIDDVDDGEVQYEIYLVDTGNTDNDFTTDFQSDIVTQLGEVDFDVINYSFVSKNNTPEFIQANLDEMNDGAYIISSLPNQGDGEVWSLDDPTSMDGILDAHDNYISVGAVVEFGSGMYVHRFDSPDYMDVAIEGHATMVLPEWFGTSFAAPKMAGIIAELIGTGESNSIGDIALIDTDFISETPFGDILVSDGAILT